MTDHVCEAIVHFRQVRRENERLFTADSWSRVCLVARKSRDSFAVPSLFAAPHHKRPQYKQLQSFELTPDTPPPLQITRQAQPCIARQQRVFESQQAPVHQMPLSRMLPAITQRGRSIRGMPALWGSWPFVCCNKFQSSLNAFVDSSVSSTR